ncbi:MAG: ferritin [Erysipelotrichaceae bacterium]|nr:ferritin [Erysipelotrichaceae bacterium]
MLNEKTKELLNSQINKEFYSAYLYLAFANYFDNNGLDGFANYFKIQAQEERDHALLFLEFLQNNGILPMLEGIEKPNQNFSSIKEVLQEALNHEKYVTASINTIYDEAINNKDYRTTQFLDWFVKEQLEEEKSADDLLVKWDMYGEDKRSLYLLDKELSERVYTAPSLQL